MCLGFNGWGLFSPWFRQSTGGYPLTAGGLEIKKEGDAQ
jgi:hypothetical protein